jgi:hypothetical protein
VYFLLTWNENPPGFGDCLELGIPGLGVLTWEESKTHLALFAVTSQPLFLGNDVRPGYMQQRLVDILTNEDMLVVNQQVRCYRRTH